MFKLWSIEPRPFVEPVAPDDPYDYLNDPALSPASKQRQRLSELCDGGAGPEADQHFDRHQPYLEQCGDALSLCADFASDAEGEALALATAEWFREVARSLRSRAAAIEQDVKQYPQFWQSRVSAVA